MAAERHGTGAERRFPFRGLRGAMAFGLISGGLQVYRGVLALRRARRNRAGALTILRPFLEIGAGSALAAAAVSARRAGVRLTDDGVDVDLGWYWRGAIPYAAIARVEEVRNPLWAGLGVRTDFNTFLALVLWGREVTALVFESPRPLPLNPLLPFLRPRLQQLRLGLEDSDGFRSAVAERIAATSGPVEQEPRDE